MPTSNSVQDRLARAVGVIWQARLPSEHSVGYAKSAKADHGPTATIAQNLRRLAKLVVRPPPLTSVVRLA